jgi:hypothetical protein
MLDGHIQTCFNKDTHALFMLYIVFVASSCVLFYDCSLIYFIFVRLSFVFCSSCVQLLFHLILLCSLIVHCSLFIRKIFNSDPGLYSRYFDPVVREVPVTITIYASQ